MKITLRHWIPNYSTTSLLIGLLSFPLYCLFNWFSQFFCYLIVFQNVKFTFYISGFSCPNFHTKNITPYIICFFLFISFRISFMVLLNFFTKKSTLLKRFIVPTIYINDFLFPIALVFSKLFSWKLHHYFVLNSPIFTFSTIIGIPDYILISIVGFFLYFIHKMIDKTLNNYHLTAAFVLAGFSFILYFPELWLFFFLKKHF